MLDDYFKSLQANLDVHLKWASARVSCSCIRMVDYFNQICVFGDWIYYWLEMGVM